MLAEEIALGTLVRYPRTGTTGTVLRIEHVGGGTFAELDTTHLLYRVNELIPAAKTEKASSTVIEDAKKVIERERDFAAGIKFQETLMNIDHSCEGGG
jgi:hypothetical protein